MIDFRYHLVSLVSVFLALAVGIVLGAGPLKGTIARTLANETAALREQQATLRSDLSTAQTGLARRDEFIAAVAPSLVAEQLGGHSVVLVVLPDADTGAVKSLTQLLTTAGAKVTGRLNISSTWADPAKAGLRDRLAADLQGSLPAGSPAMTTSQRLSALLARSLVTAELAQAQRSDATAATVLQALQGAGLVSVDGDLLGRATEAVVLAPAVPEATAAEDPSPSPSNSVDATPMWRELAGSLDAGSDGAVVTGPASSATPGGVVAAVRADSGLSGGVSTVDTGGTPMGTVATVLALREQLSDAAGNYGFGDGAKSPLPALAGVAP